MTEDKFANLLVGLGKKVEMRKFRLTARDTDYEILVFGPLTNFSFQTLGNIQYGYLIVEGMRGKSYLFQGDPKFGGLHPSYVAEKLDIRGDTDTAYFTRLISSVLGRDIIGVTDQSVLYAIVEQIF